MKIFKKFNKKEEKVITNSKDAAKERLHLVLMQDRANVSADFLELMKQEIIEVIKKYIDVDESAIDVRLTNKENEDGTNGAPALYANIPIMNIKNESRKIETKENEEEKGEKTKEVVPKDNKNDKEEKHNKKEGKKENKKEEKTEVIIDDGKKDKEQQTKKVEENTEEKLK